MFSFAPLGDDAVRRNYTLNHCSNTPRTGVAGWYQMAMRKSWYHSVAGLVVARSLVRKA
jgi:hypothetical protein